jgi:hypothetical protein
VKKQSPDTLTEKSVLDSDLMKIAAAQHHNPFCILGRHPKHNKIHVRLYLPYAQAVSFTHNNIDIPRIEGSDFFEYMAKKGELPPHYAISWVDKEGEHHENYDPYDFGVQLPEFDLHLFGEGKHWHIYQKLGAHLHTADGIDGVLFAIKHNANVINMSLGKLMPDQLTHASVQDQQAFINSALKDEEDFWKEVFDYAEKQNVTIVVAAGNENAMVGLDPMQRSDIVIKVSAADVSNKKADYSNFGPLTTICAPGSKIYNCYPNNTYQFLDGTSMAAPIVAGAVALMKSVNPNLKNRDIINILKSTGKPLGDNKIGSMLQIDKALEAARNIR